MLPEFNKFLSALAAYVVEFAHGVLNGDKTRRVVLDKASATTTTLRKITITSQGFRRHDGRMIPLDEEASLWGVDLSAIAAPDAQLDWFAHKVTQLCNMYANMNGGMTTRLDKYLANVPH
ncbi:hypothetical protein DYB34_012391 [Aphanomyces astaci]|uniref:Uncharacterized protein n=1 Tax=Aphanomyces astaci TaxID=112090 RepID=A0A3R6W9S7_APHAT|nr:hypothetical protein DYB34_012391 [Aphanomyces astaci]